MLSTSGARQQWLAAWRSRRTKETQLIWRGGGSSTIVVSVHTSSRLNSTNSRRGLKKIAEEKHAKKSKRERPAKVKKTEKKKKDLPKKSAEAPPAKAKKTSKKGDATKKAKGKQLSAHEEEVFTNAKINFKAMHAWQGRCSPGAIDGASLAPRK
eukprot:TRINITY_DN112_c0_g1_i5.p1 TRINITY_DN112_c0_g1~~TRINITY_DN112_c0_g1_i5.p1  ORF type:complete len:154 (-),score=27.43 TRINITY_DN112_c0_g1_i5:54-515(-)